MAVDWVWIVTPNGAFRRMRRSDERLDFRVPHSPPGNARLRVRAGKFHYVPFGTTPEDAARNCNQYALDAIARLDAILASLRAMLVIVPERLP